MIVTTEIAGSKVCVFSPSGEAYIDARQHRMRSENRIYEADVLNVIELVRGGQVRQCIRCRAVEAPALIVRLMRNKFQPLPDFPVSEFQSKHPNTW